MNSLPQTPGSRFAVQAVAGQVMLEVMHAEGQNQVQPALALTGGPACPDSPFSPFSPRLPGCPSSPFIPAGPGFPGGP